VLIFTDALWASAIGNHSSACSRRTCARLRARRVPGSAPRTCVGTRLSKETCRCSRTCAVSSTAGARHRRRALRHRPTCLSEQDPWVVTHLRSIDAPARSPKVGTPWAPSTRADDIVFVTTLRIALSCMPSHRAPTPAASRRPIDGLLLADCSAPPAVPSAEMLDFRACAGRIRRICPRATG